MTADTFDSILGLLLMGTGNDNNSWGTNANNSDFIPTARAIAGVNLITDTGGTRDLSGSPPPAGLRADIDRIQKATGALISDLTVQVPNVSKTWVFWNATSNAFNMYVKVPGGVARANASTPGGLVQIPQGCIIEVFCDGSGSLVREDDREIGEIVMSTKGAAGPGELALNGASLLRATFPDLFGKQGTTWGSADGTHFTLPNLLDTNRFPRAGGGSGPAVGTYQANQNLAHSHTVTGAPGAGTLGTDSQGSHSHTANVSDPTHTHSLTTYLPSGGFYQSGTSGSFILGNSGISNTNGAATGVTVSIVSAGAHTHNITGAPSLGTLGTASSGGTEARPESAAILMCVRY